MMRQTNPTVTGLNEHVMTFQNEPTTGGSSLVSAFAGNPVLRKHDVSIALQDYTPADGYRIRFVLRNRQKMFWSYPGKQARDKELKKVYYDLLD